MAHNGADWRTADGRSINQIDSVIQQIRQTPDSRRLLVSAWNVGEIKEMALPPCHALFQFFVQDGEPLAAQLYQRSADLFLGCAIQHCFLRFADPDGSASLSIEARGLCSHFRRFASLQQPC